MHQAHTTRSLFVVSGLAFGLAGLAGGLGGCSTMSADTRADSETAGRAESPVVLEERDASDRVMKISVNDLFEPKADPFLEGENSDDAWRVVEATAFAERNPAPAYTKPKDRSNVGPNLAASLYGSLMETTEPIPQRAENPGFQTNNSRQVTFTGEGSDFDPIVSKDGRYIIYASTQHSATADIYIKQVDSRVITRLTMMIVPRW